MQSNIPNATETNMIIAVKISLVNLEVEDFSAFSETWLSSVLRSLLCLAEVGCIFSLSRL